MSEVSNNNNNRLVGNLNSVQFSMYMYRAAERFGIRDMSLTKTQKLLYLCYGGFMLINNSHTAVLLDEQPQAWPYGPVFSNVYDLQAKLKSNNISFTGVGEEQANFTDYDDLLEAIFHNFGNKSATWLTNFTHQPGGAWEKAKKEAESSGRNPWRYSLKDSDIFEDFRKNAQ